MSTQQRLFFFLNLKTQHPDTVHESEGGGGEPVSVKANIQDEPKKLQNYMTEDDLIN